MWLQFCLTCCYQDMNSQHTSILTISFETPCKIKQDIFRPYQCLRCGYTFAWHLAVKTWLPNTHQFWHLLWKAKKDQTRYLGHTTVRCVVVSLMDILLSRHEFPTHIYSDNWLWNAMKDQTRYLGPTSICGYTFAWHLAVKTWLHNTHQYWYLL